MIPARAPLKALDVALAELLAQVSTLHGVEEVTTFEADGRVLAQNMLSSFHPKTTVLWTVTPCRWRM
jgi:molybdopterin molybdotransferase